MITMIDHHFINDNNMHEVTEKGIEVQDRDGSCLLGDEELVSDNGSIAIGGSP